MNDEQLERLRELLEEPYEANLDRVGDTIGAHLMLVGHPKIVELRDKAQDVGYAPDEVQRALGRAFVVAGRLQSDMQQEFAALLHLADRDEMLELAFKRQLGSLPPRSEK